MIISLCYATSWQQNTINIKNTNRTENIFVQSGVMISQYFQDINATHEMQCDIMTFLNVINVATIGNNNTFAIRENHLRQLLNVVNKYFNISGTNITVRNNNTF